MSNDQQQRGTGDTATLCDLHREIHSAMLYALSGVTTLARRTDAADADALRCLLDDWRRVVSALGRHHEHGGRPCEPKIQRHAPAPTDEFELARCRTDAAFAQLHRLGEGRTEPMRAGQQGPLDAGADRRDEDDELAALTRRLAAASRRAMGR
jgi:hypothetical protein